MQIDQAIFSSTESRRTRGYHLVATTDGVTPREARELTRWGPSHDSLLDEQGSINYHPLLSGRFCVSKTYATDAEPSRRGGLRVRTQSMLLTAEQFWMFGCNAFNVVRAAEATERFYRELDEVENGLERLSLEKPPNQSLNAKPIQETFGQLNGESLARLLNITINTCQLGIVGSEKPASLLEALINLIPPTNRCAYSFSTGLRYSNSRPFRIIPIEDDLYQRKLVLRTGRGTLVDLLQEFPNEFNANHGWADVVEDALKREAIDELAEFYQELNDFTLAEPSLDELKQRWFQTRRLQSPPATSNTPMDESAEDQPDDFHATTLNLLPHEAQISAQSASHPNNVNKADGKEPTKGILDLAEDELVDELAQIDDVVLDAIRGKQNSLANLQHLWPKLTERLSPALVEESRCQYLQFALQAWDAQQSQSARNADQAVAVLDLLSFLFNDQ